jgi:hypothetical protein
MRYPLNFFENSAAAFNHSFSRKPYPLEGEGWEGSQTFAAEGEYDR